MKLDSQTHKGKKVSTSMRGIVSFVLALFLIYTGGSSVEYLVKIGMHPHSSARIHNRLSLQFEYYLVDSKEEHSQ